MLLQFYLYKITVLVSAIPGVQCQKSISHDTDVIHNPCLLGKHFKANTSYNLTLCYIHGKARLTAAAAIDGGKL